MEEKRRIGCWAILKRGVGVGGSSSCKPSAAIASRDSAPNIPRSSLVFDAGNADLTSSSSTDIHLLTCLLYLFMDIYMYGCSFSYPLSFIDQYFPVLRLNSDKQHK